MGLGNSELFNQLVKLIILIRVIQQLVIHRKTTWCKESVKGCMPKGCRLAGWLPRGAGFSSNTWGMNKSFLRWTYGRRSPGRGNLAWEIAEVKETTWVASRYHDFSHVTGLSSVEHGGGEMWVQVVSPGRGGVINVCEYTLGSLEFVGLGGDRSSLFDQNLWVFWAVGISVLKKTCKWFGPLLDREPLRNS